MSYFKEISHSGLHKHRVIRAREPWVVEAKVAAQMAAWDEQWRQKQEKGCAAQYKESRKQEAEDISNSAKTAREQLRSILKRTAQTAGALDWSKLLDHRPFLESRPAKPELPPKPVKPKHHDHWPSQEHQTAFRTHHEAIVPSDSGHSLAFDAGQVFRAFLEILIPSRKRKRIDREIWEDGRLVAQEKETYAKAVEDYNHAVTLYNSEIKRIEQEWKITVHTWDQSKSDFFASQHRRNEDVHNTQKKWSEGDPSGIEQHAEFVLQGISFSDVFPGAFTVEFNPDNKTLIVEFDLPAIDDLPAAKSARFVASRDEIKFENYTKDERRELYDEVVYQTSLSVIHALFSADTVSAIQSVVFNGRVKTTDKATGRAIEPCILSLHTTRDEFLAIDLTEVDPARCVRKLGGVAATTLSTMTPVPPVLTINRNGSFRLFRG